MSYINVRILFFNSQAQPFVAVYWLIFPFAHISKANT